MHKNKFITTFTTLSIDLVTWIVPQHMYIYLMNFTQCIDISSFPFEFFISAFGLLLINSSNHLLARTQNLAYKLFCSFVERLFFCFLFSTRLIDRFASNRFSFSFRVFFFQPIFIQLISAEYIFN